MKSNNFVLLLLTILLVACHPSFKNKDLVFPVHAALETTPVETADDAADDICIWIHPKDVSKSTIIGTNKKQGLCVYNLQGKLLYNYKVGSVNNVDIRNNFVYKTDTLSIVTASNRSNNTITVHKVNLNGTLTNMAPTPIQSNLSEIYGLCMYQNKKNTYVFVSGKQGGIEKWKLVPTSNGIEGRLETTFQIGSITEGMVADDETGFIYIAEENIALWKYNADKLNLERTLVAKTSDINLKDDFEGVTIYKKAEKKGYLLLSSQGNNSYAVFDRETNQYLKSFVIEQGSIDGTNDTDGIDATSVSLPNFPKGIFIAQDGENIDGVELRNQNFKIVDFRNILKELN